MATSEVPDIRGALRAELVRDLALGELTHEQLGEKYDRTTQAIHEFSSRNKAEIRRAKQVQSDEYQGLGYAEKWERLAVREQLVRDIEERCCGYLTPGALLSGFISETPGQRVSTATDRRSCPNLDSHPRHSTLMEDQMVKVMTAGKGKTPIGPVYFTRDYVRHGFLFKKRYSQGARGVILREHRLLGQVTHVDMRLPDGKFLLDVPIDYIKTLD